MCIDFLSGVIKLDCLVFVIVVESPSSGSVRDRSGWRVARDWVLAFLSCQEVVSQYRHH